MAGRTGVKRTGFRDIVAGGAAFQGDRWFGGGVAGIAPLHIMQSVQ